MKKRVLMLLVACCGPAESMNPLVPADKGVLDKGLLGTWEGGDGKDTMTLVFEVKAGAVMTVTAPPPKEEDGKKLVFEAHACTVGGTKFLNARAMEEGKPASNWLIVRYEVAKDGSLTLYTLKDDAVRAAFDAKKLAGKSEGSPAQLTITDTVEKLKAFVAKKEVFEKFGTFKKKS